MKALVVSGRLGPAFGHGRISIGRDDSVIIDRLVPVGHAFNLISRDTYLSQKFEKAKREAFRTFPALEIEKPAAADVWAGDPDTDKFWRN